MSERGFYEDEVRAQVTGAIKSIEAGSSAEIVVTLRRSSGTYQQADYLAGALAGLAALAALLYLPQAFPLRALLLGPPLAFALIALLSAWVAPLRRLFTARKLQVESVRRSARAAFVDHGMARTRRRTGILVYVSLFERQVECVADVSVDLAALGPAWSLAMSRVGMAVARRDPPGFVVALRGLAPILGAGLPRRPGDENELPDEMEVAP